MASVEERLKVWKPLEQTLRSAKMNLLGEILLKKAAEERRKEKEAATLAQLAAQEKRAEEVGIQSTAHVAQKTLSRFT